jgi:tRNA(Ile)-lysidine synthase
MAACGPFEPAPRVAVAVSGGPDSLALTLLLQDWLAAEGGQLSAFLVDHRLRPESGREARQVAAALARRGIAVEVLTWRADAPAEASGGGLQARARAARHALLADACGAAGILHLALAHHRDDQAETVLQRQAAGSGPDGLAAMAPVTEREAVRLIRPLLAVPKARLAATCRAAGLPFVEDPSNGDPRFARSRIRARLTALGAEGHDPTAELAEAATAAGLDRARRERAVADLLAESVSLHPAGFARMGGALPAAPDVIALRALSNLLACVGGAAWPTRTARLEAGLARLRGESGRAFTLGGCRLRPAERGWLVVREAATPEELALAPGRSALWDGRFRVGLAAAAPAPVTVRALGERGWQDLVRRRPDLRRAALPAPVRGVVPLFCDLEGPLAVPHLGFWRATPDADWLHCTFSPRRALAPAELALSFTVA